MNGDHSRTGSTQSPWLLSAGEESINDLSSKQPVCPHFGSVMRRRLRDEYAGSVMVYKRGKICYLRRNGLHAGPGMSRSGERFERMFKRDNVEPFEWLFNAFTIRSTP